jgi:hypothetical protein
LKVKIVLAVLALVLFQVGLAHAGGRYSAFGGAGIAKPEGIDVTFFAAGGLRYEFKPNWAVEPMVGYWKANDVEKQCPSPGCATYDLRDIQLGANLLYVGAFKKVGTFVGGGLSAHFRDQTATLPPGSNKRQPPDRSATRLGFQFLGGLDIPITHKLAFTTEVAGNFIDREDPLDTQYVFTWHGGLRFFFN